MKTTLIILFAALAVRAADVQLAWDAVPTATNYVLYTTSADGTTTRQNTGTNTTATPKLVAGQWTFQVSAQNESMESERCLPLTVQVVAPPAGFRVVQVQVSANLKLTQ